MNSKKGFSLLELLVAIGIASIILVTALATVGNVFLNQKKVLTAQNFYRESQVLMERIQNYIRDYTLDYDRYFSDPAYSSASNNSCQTDTNGLLPYPDQFFHEINGDIFNLGGQKPTSPGDPTPITDPCSEAWVTGNVITDLYLINSERDTRLRITQAVDTDGAGRVQLSTESGQDANGDGITEWDPPVVSFVSPRAIDVSELSFSPGPPRDPYLAFALTQAQVQPFVFVFMNTTLHNPTRYNFTQDSAPQINLQTLGSSRVYGNIR